jgi:hypothetical protein
MLVGNKRGPPKTLAFFAPARFALLRCKTPKTLVVHWRADFASMSPLRSPGSRGHIAFDYRNSTAHYGMTSFDVRENRLSIVRLAARRQLAIR